MRDAIIYLLAITLAEVITVIVQPVWGVVCHIAILMAILLHAAVASEDRSSRQLILSLALVPLVRIISLSMPLANIPQIWWYPVVYTPLLAAAAMVVRILGFKAADVGLNFRLLPVQLLIGFSGFVLGVAEYLILTPEPVITELTWQQAWPMALVYLLCTGFGEEFIFRGVMQRMAVEAFGWRGIVYVSMLFAVVHLVHYPEVGLLMVLVDVVFVFVVAMFFGWLVKKTGSILGVTLSHGVTNSILYLAAPFLF